MCILKKPAVAGLYGVLTAFVAWTWEHNNDASQKTEHQQEHETDYERRKRDS